MVVSDRLTLTLRWPARLIASIVIVSGVVAATTTQGQDAPAVDVQSAGPEAQDAAPVETPTESSPGEVVVPAPPPVQPRLDPGQADLDEAVLKRIDAESNAELKAVAALIESALAKGLSDENKSFAKKMLGSIQFQRGQGLAGVMVRVRGRRQVTIRDEALTALEDAVANDPELADAHMLIARLNLLPDGDREAVQRATSAAIDLYLDDKKKRSAAFLLRAVTSDDDDSRLADLNSAIDVFPENIDALRERAGMKLKAGEIDSAVADLRTVLELDPTNQQIATAAVQQLVDLDRADDAVQLLSQSIEAQPSEGLYRLRAILHRMLDDDEKAFADLNKALAMQPKDPVALLQRAEIALSRGDVQAAKQDLKAATDITPEVESVDQALAVRCYIAVEEGRVADAITDMKTLVERNPDDVARQMQLANLYLQDDRPRQAIEALSDVLQNDARNVPILRTRGDAYLAVGEHAKAIEDYETALEAIESDEHPSLTGILNNLAWVLATSPQDSVRNGSRSLELGKRAVELTEESEAHILSTLAAGYAEVGDFENAVKWSQKAVDLGRAEDNSQIQQLEEELESYRKNEPWREEQDTEENQLPILSADDVIDT
ncbi:MAG: tetratricopeptide repeat protein [Planctomycetota bacterium]